MYYKLLYAMVYMVYHILDRQSMKFHSSSNIVDGSLNMFDQQVGFLKSYTSCTISEYDFEFQIGELLNKVRNSLPPQKEKRGAAAQADVVPGES